jgi:hypothetical protein
LQAWGEKVAKYFEMVNRLEGKVALITGAARYIISKPVE